MPVPGQEPLVEADPAGESWDDPGTFSPEAPAPDADLPAGTESPHDLDPLDEEFGEDRELLDHELLDHELPDEESDESDWEDDAEPGEEFEDLDGPLYQRSPHDPRPLVAQPVIAMRARGHLSMITVGLLFAIVGALCTVGSSVTMLRLTDTSPILPAVGNLAAVLNALVAFLQWQLWRMGLKEWAGIKDAGLHEWINITKTGVWISVIGAVVVPICAWVMLEDSSRSESSWWLALVGAICVILGTALAGVHRFRPEGPRGVPPRIRRNHQRHAVWRAQMQLDD
ncbi:hypothetical protein ACPCG0_03395 [Propionibacteriaceae bacterium Y1923]